MSAKVIPFYNPKHKNAKPAGKAAGPWKPVKVPNRFCLMAMTGVDTLCTLVASEPVTPLTPKTESLRELMEACLGPLIFDEGDNYEDPTYSCFDDDCDYYDSFVDAQYDFCAPASDRIVERDQNVVHVSFPFNWRRITF